MDTQKLPTARDLNGNVITVADLPKPNTRRWTANRKAIVISAVRNGVITLEQVLARYSMTEREFRIWEQGFKSDGATGLKVTHYQRRGSPR
ncbi:MAG TPA: DUF1153 domain-containing protein [Candidatus Paceibacterota bacterium]|nr:DUF1153 domain-containing protein [Candidatus Paceibacterota bacterium]